MSAEDFDTRSRRGFVAVLSGALAALVGKKAAAQLGDPCTGYCDGKVICQQYRDASGRLYTCYRIRRVSYGGCCKFQYCRGIPGGSPGLPNRCFYGGCKADYVQDCY